MEELALADLDAGERAIRENAFVCGDRMDLPVCRLELLCPRVEDGRRPRVVFRFSVRHRE